MYSASGRVSCDERIEVNNCKCLRTAPLNKCCALARCLSLLARSRTVLHHSPSARLQPHISHTRHTISMSAQPATTLSLAHTHSPPESRCASLVRKTNPYAANPSCCMHIMAISMSDLPAGSIPSWCAALCTTSEKLSPSTPQCCFKSSTISASVG